MIEGLEFYKLNKNKLEMYEMTKNTIVIFDDLSLKNKFRNELLKINDITNKDVGYVSANDKNITIKEIVNNNQTSIFITDDNDKQIITLSLNPRFILKCNDVYDLWFCNKNRNNEVQLYSFIEFENYEKYWNKGVNYVCRMYLDKRFNVK